MYTSTTTGEKKIEPIEQAESIVSIDDIFLLNQFRILKNLEIENLCLNF